MSISKLRVETPIDALRLGRVWPLAPMGLGLGVILGMEYFDWAQAIAWLIWPFVALTIWITWRGYGRYAQIIFALCAVIIGFTRLGWDYRQNDTRLLDFRYYGDIAGRVVHIDQSSSGALRLTLDQTVLNDVRDVERVRISLHGEYIGDLVRAGAWVRTTGHLTPPSGPAEPSGYDFRMHAWRKGISATGYTTKPLIVSPNVTENWQLAILDFRHKRAARIRERLGDRIGGFASAIMLGVRSHMDAEAVDAMRASNLAHLLAISGMHMGTVCGLVYLFARRLLGTRDFRLNADAPRQIAVLLALSMTSLYWLVSGMAYSATRAFFMAILVFGALALFRRALSLRNISLVASGLVIWNPNAIADVGFQMSFAATTALVVFFGRYNINHWTRFQAVNWLAALAMTSLIAGLATAPFAAYHFNTMPKYGLLANLLAVPIMSFVVMPAAIVAMIGFDSTIGMLALDVVGWGIERIIAVGSFVSGIEHSVRFVGAAHRWGFALVIIGGLMMAFHRWRLIPIATIALGITIWPHASRHQLLIADSARFFGLKTETGPRLYSRATGHKFVAEIWAKRDGYLYDQEANFIDIEGDPMLVDLGQGWQMVFTTTKKGAARLPEFCAERRILVAAQARGWAAGDCRYFNEYDIRDRGGMAIDIIEGEAIITPNIDPTRVPWKARR